MSFDSNSLQSLCVETNVSSIVMKEAERLCIAYVRNNSLPQPLYLYTASIIAAVSLTKSVPPAFYLSIFRNLPCPEEFIEFFQDFLKISDLHMAECEELIENYAFSWRLYKKFLEKWAYLELEEKQGYSGTGPQLRDMVWVLICVKRSQSPSSDLVENACLILGLLHFALTHLPSTISFATRDSLDFLVRLFNGNLEQASESCRAVEGFLVDLKHCDIIRSNSADPTNFEGIFSASHYHYNLNRLIEYYLQNLGYGLVSEIEFMKKNLPKTPVKLTRSRKTNVELKSKRIISWGPEGESSVKSKLGEIPVAASPSHNSFTPMSEAMELNNWLRDILKRTSLNQIPILLQEYDSVANFSVYAKIESFRNQLSTVFVEKENLPMVPENTANKSKTESILKLYVYSLQGMMKNEQKGQGNLSNLYGNENFHQATFACSIECVVFYYGLNLNFEQVLRLAEVSVFEFWKLTSTFMQFDAKMPISLRKHFKDMESYILNENAWSEHSAINNMLSQYVSECKTSSGSPIFSIFFKRLLSFLAQKLIEITDQLEILEEVKERVWELVKLCITEHSDLFYNRTLDTIILCSIYAICKLYKPVSFKILIENFLILNPNKDHVFKQIAGVGDIVKFYNLHFIPQFKEYLSQGPECTKSYFQSPLRASMSITSPAKSSTFCSPKTPYLTPRTRKLWASSETSHTITQKKGRLISFDDEPRLPKIEEDSPIACKKK